MLPFPVSRDASMAAEAAVADVGRESKSLTVGFEKNAVAQWKHVETTGLSNFRAAMVEHGIDRSKLCTMMSIATDLQVVLFKKGSGTRSIFNGHNKIVSSGQVA